MSRLVRMDQTGHTTLAEWTADDPASVEAAVAAFREPSSTVATSRWSRPARATPSRSRSCPLDAPLVILRLPISGG